MGADSADLYKKVYSHVGGSGGNQTSLVPQAIATSKKKDKWYKKNMDRLEDIGLAQINKNSVFNDYYAMWDGDLEYMFYTGTPKSLQGIASMMEEKHEIPEYVGHYDIIGRLGRHLNGKYNDTKSKFRVDFFDAVGQNEYTREMSNRLFNYTQKLFQIELQSQLARIGVNLQKKFNSKEEQKRYLQQLEQKKAQLDTPPEIKTAMSTKWKPMAAKWAENTLEKDRLRFDEDLKEKQYFKDKYLTGRYFKHYKIGYDYYKPESWDPRETFFSEDSKAKYPQDGEYVGNIQDMSASEIIDSFGYLMTEKDQKKILNYYDVSSSEDSSDVFSRTQEADTEILPDKNYYDRKSTVALQQATGQPLGESIFKDEDGEVQKTESWVPDYNEGTSGGKISKWFRTDIDVRNDTLRVTQAYWKSWDRIGLIYYQSKLGFKVTEWVTDELLEGFKEENNIKELKNKSLSEFKEEFQKGTLEPNCIVYTYAPRVYKGVKISGSESILGKDLYLDTAPLEFQIKGNSDLYDVKLPVSGYIGTSDAKRLVPYQREHNYHMNLIHSLTEKELGIFWLFDVTLLPSEYKGMGDARETLNNVVDMARDIGLVPIDMSKENMRDRQGQQFNSMMPQDVSFTKQIQEHKQTADYYKYLALEQIGVTQQDLGTPDQYSTATGIKLGQVNSHSQIEGMFQEMDSARLKDMEMNLSIAQFSQKNNKSISFAYSASSGEQNLIKETFSDDNFHLRKFGLMPVEDSKKRKELESFKQFLLQSNTFENDLSDMAEIISSDSFQVVTNIAKKSMRERRQVEQQKRQHELQLQQQKQQGEQQQRQQEQNFQLVKQQRQLENEIRTANIQAAARLQDRNNTQEDIEDINKIAQDYLKDEQANRKMDIQEASNDIKRNMDKAKIRQKDREIELKEEQNDIKRKEIEAKKFGDIINKN